MGYDNIIACDFDGTLFTDAYPDIGEPIYENINALKAEQETGTQIILWTCRTGVELQKAIYTCLEKGIFFDAVNRNLHHIIKEFGGDQRKIFAHEYWDDRAVPKTANGIGKFSDGYHTFDDLYKQRLILSAALFNAYKHLAWKSRKHSDGELCFGGEWFIVGINTPMGVYTYHYEDEHWELFDIPEIATAPAWDGHTDKDVERLLSLTLPYSEVITCKKISDAERVMRLLDEGKKTPNEIRKIFGLPVKDGYAPNNVIHDELCTKEEADGPT